MKLPGRRRDDSDTDGAEGAVELTEPDAARTITDDPTGTPRSGTTAPKGRPTPKRSAATTRRRGPVAPAPMTSAEARARRKSLRPKLTRAERRETKAQRREVMFERRDRMLAGDERYLSDRDRGPVRRYVRDVVDARYNVLGLFLPAAIGLLVMTMAAPAPQVQIFVSLAMMTLMAAMAVDGVLLSRRVTRLVDAKFPDNVESRWKLGFYAASRASQMRRMRAPRPQVRRGDRVD